MALASARPGCLVSSSGADYKAWSGAGQNCNVFVRSAASQRLANHKPAAGQPLIGGQLIKFWLKNHFNSISIKNPYPSKKNFIRHIQTFLSGNADQRQI